MTTYPIGTLSGGEGTSALTLSLALNLISSMVAFEATLSNANSPVFAETKTLSSGDNTITVPSKAGGVVVVPPAGNTQALKLVSASGITVSPTAPIVLTFASTPPASFVINAAGTVTSAKFYWF